MKFKVTKFVNKHLPDLYYKALYYSEVVVSLSVIAGLGGWEVLIRLLGC